MKKHFLPLLVIAVLSTVTPTAASAASARISWNANSESDLAGYHVHYGQASGSYTETADAGMATSLVVPDLQSGGTYYFTISAYDTSDNESILSLEVSYTVDAANIINSHAPSNYNATMVNTGDTFYVDNNLTITTIPAELQNSVWLRSAAADVNQTSADFIRFTTDRDAIVYVGYDSTATSVPDWLKNSFVPSGDGPTANDGAISFDMWARNYPAGEIVLGGNMASGAAGAVNNLIILVRVMNTSPTTGDIDGDNMPDSWENTVGLDENAFNAHDDNDGDGYTNLHEFWLQSDPGNLLSPNDTTIPSSNVPPILTAPASVIGTINSQIDITTQATDADGDNLIWGWSQNSGPAVDLGSLILNSDSFSFTPTQSGLFIFRVIVSDDQGEFDAATVRVEIFENILASELTSGASDLSITSGDYAGTQLHIPDGSLDKQYNVVIGYRDLPKTLPQGHELISPVIQFSPIQVSLLIPVTIRMPYDINGLATAIGASSEINLMWYDPINDAWAEIVNTTDTGSALEATVSELGTFIVTSSTITTTGTQTGNGSGGGGASIFLPLLLLPGIWQRRRSLTKNVRSSVKLSRRIPITSRMNTHTNKNILRSIILCLLALCTLPSLALAANFPLQVLIPRAAGTSPDAGSPTLSADHFTLWAYPGITYRMRTAVVGGDFPYTFALSGQPSGMSIDSEGVITWINPQSGDPSITLTVTDASGIQIQSVWGITVDANKFRFLDCDVAGPGTGSIGDPWKNINNIPWSQGGPTVGKILYFRDCSAAGYYNGLAPGFRNETEARQFRSDYASQQWISYPGERPIFNVGYEQGGEPGVFMKFQDSPMALLGFETINGHGKHFETIPNVHYGVFWDNYMHGAAGISGTNPAFIMTSSGGLDGSRSNYLIIQDNEFADWGHRLGGDGGSCIKIYAQYKLLIEDNICRDAVGTDEIEGIALKGGQMDRITVRDNTIYNVPAHPIGGNNHILENSEILFNRVYNASENAFILNQDGLITTPIHIYRNTFIGRVMVNNISGTTGPLYFSNNVIVSPDAVGACVPNSRIFCWPSPTPHPTRIALSNNLEGTASQGITDATGNLTVAFSAYLGTHGYQISASGDTIAPSIPANLNTLAVSSSQIDISWTASTDNVGVTGYRIYRCQGSGCTPSTLVATVTGTTHQNINLSASTLYRHNVAAYDAAGNNSSQSSTAQATTLAPPPDTTPPSQPSGITVQPEP